MTAGAICEQNGSYDRTRRGMIAMAALARPDPHVLPPHPSLRGYHAVYRQQETNHCPGCGRTHWYVGRISAECCFCATALPFAGPGAHEAPVQ